MEGWTDHLVTPPEQLKPLGRVAVVHLLAADGHLHRLERQRKIVDFATRLWTVVDGSWDLRGGGGFVEGWCTSPLAHLERQRDVLGGRRAQLTDGGGSAHLVIEGDGR